MTPQAIARIVLKMKPKAPLNEYSRIEWMLQKAAELGYMACMTEFLNFGNRKYY